ncbi:signal recognition particle receptor, beta subunit, putative [Plasmodium malariae]|uniref:Signal recognition particle receptor subunit beta n=3 Tax=Plasmodium (Plasmodium) TaxID=418103 RepID=A0A1D3TFJ3_PLAMA|nr:signal recognition particle receptor, beta subunit, putative [Plasmodium malariae]SCP03739.1 signal recognition particle receptor, beta subunit, putative [Plasmodium malariae]
MDILIKILKEVVYEIKKCYLKYGINLNEFQNLLFIITVLLGLLFLFYVILILYSIFFKGNKPNQIVLLLGPCDSGKTTLLFKLKTDKICRTVPSMKENIAFINLKNKKKKKKFIRFVDFPGHPKLSYAMNKYFSITNVIVYMLDSSDRQSLKVVAEKLFELFTNKVIVKKQIPFIVLCNKTDLCNSRPKQVIKEDLEREIEILKMSKYNSLDDEDNEETECFVGANSEFFRFEKAPCHTEICSASVKNNNIEELLELIEKYY